MIRKRRSSRYRAPDYHGEPIKDFSILPILIFVSLLTLIALHSYRPQTHAVVIDLPILSGNDQTGVLWEVPPPRNHISIEASGILRWNGNSIDGPGLASELALTKSQQPQPYLLFEPDAHAAYDTVAKVLNSIFLAGLADSKFCMIGMQEHREFGKQKSGLNPTLTAQPQLRLSYTLLPSEDQPIRRNKLTIDMPAIAGECDALTQLP